MGEFWLRHMKASYYILCRNILYIFREKISKSQFYGDFIDYTPYYFQVFTKFFLNNEIIK